MIMKKDGIEGFLHDDYPQVPDPVIPDPSDPTIDFSDEAYPWLRGHMGDEIMDLGTWANQLVKNAPPLPGYGPDIPFQAKPIDFLPLVGFFFNAQRNGEREMTLTRKNGLLTAALGAWYVCSSAATSYYGGELFRYFF